MLEKHETWEVMDSSKLTTYRRCPREYFWHYILGWTPKTPSIHLCFGRAFHVAIEHLLNTSYAAREVRVANEKALAAFQEDYGLPVEEGHAKHPTNILPALVEYTARYAGELERLEIVEPEVAGSVFLDLDGKNRLYFKLDSIMRGPREAGPVTGTKPMYFSLETKTGSASLNSRSMENWIRQWMLAFQVSAYTHVLYCLFPPDEVWGVEINGVHFLKGKREFIRIPARRPLDRMNAWLWEINDWMSLVKEDHERLSKASENDKVMRAFAKNDVGCIRYFQDCPYLDLCSAWANPLQHVNTIPTDLKVKFWDPRTRWREDAKIMHLQLGGGEASEATKPQ